MKQIYSLRKDFTVIGLTGTMGSGCSKVAELLSRDKDAFFDVEMIRKPQDIQLKNEKNETIYDHVLFQRKYNICYNYMQKNWTRFIFIDYKKVLFLYCCNYFINVKKSKDFPADFSSFINKTFKKALISDKNDFDDSDKLISVKEAQRILKNKNIDLTKFISDIKTIGSGASKLINLKDPTELKILHDQFFVSSSEFNKLFRKFLKLLTIKNYYLRTLFFHKIACAIRETGSPERLDDSKDMNNVFNIAMLINRLMKSFKSFSENKDYRHIVINSLKNSLEIMYFKERYSAFYMIAVHNENNKLAIFNDIVKKRKDKPSTVDKLMQLDKAEYRTNDFRKGLFSSPDIENCIQKSDIHLLFSLPKGNLENLPPKFSTIHEQLLKYLALIRQPGIITPSNTERCMQIAFNSKLNSGCISRQVGAVVTNSGFAIKSIGWNDTPKKTIPCILRNVGEVINGSSLKCEDHTYSKFELPKHEFRYPLNNKHFNQDKSPTNERFAGKNFSNNVKALYPEDKINIIKAEGKNCSYCFKSLHNQFVGEDNQVHTRSLHAEENAMLQISKSGGQGLENGYLFVTASPCELCSKKSYQLGIRQIFYIDRYPGIAKEHIIDVGFDAPHLNQFTGVVGRSFNKIYEPFLAYKDELIIYLNN